MTGRGASADVGCAALHDDERHALGDRAHALEERPPVDHAFDVREADVGLVIVGVEVEVVGHGHHRGVAGADGPAHADSVVPRSC